MRNSDGRITSWRILSIVLVQIVLWDCCFFRRLICSDISRSVFTGWEFPLTVFGSSILLWFALLMILQYVWTITRATLSTGVVALMARLGSQWAKQALDDGHRQWRFTSAGLVLARDGQLREEGGGKSGKEEGLSIENEVFPPEAEEEAVPATKMHSSE